MVGMTTVRKGHSLPPGAWLGLLVFAFHLLFILIVQDYGWDDGTITLSFSRTLSSSGKLALTPSSEVVEGYSSTLWMLAMAAWHHIMQPGFSVFIRISQLSAALMGALSSVLFFQLFRRIWGKQSRTAAFTIALLLFIQKPFVTESINGMEMEAAAALALLLTLLIAQASTDNSTKLDRKQIIKLIIVAALASLIRFEFIVYLLGASLTLLRSSRKLALSIATGALAGFGANSLHRYITFQDFLPNTIHAKRWPPYKNFNVDSVWALIKRLQEAAHGGLEIFQANSTFFLLLLWLLIFLSVVILRGKTIVRLARQTFLDPPIAFAFGFCACVIIVSMATLSSGDGASA